jgi:hypothetical protein
LKIKRIRAQNFLSFDSRGIDISDFGDVNSFVGPNNAGKTNLFRIVRFIAEAVRSSSLLGSSLSYYHEQDLNQPFEIELSIQFTEEEIDALSDSLVCSHFMDQVNSIPSLGTNVPLPNIEPLRRFLLDVYGRRIFSSLFHGDFSIILTAGKSESYSPMPWFRIKSGDKEIYMHNFGLFTTAKEAPQGYGTVNAAERVITELAQKYSSFQNYLRGITSERPAPPEDYVPPTIVELMFRAPDSGPIVHMGFNSGRWAASQLEPTYSNTEAFQRLRTFYRGKGRSFTNSLVGFFDTFRLIFLGSIVLVSDIRGVSQKSYLENLESIEFPLHELTYDRLPEVLFKFRNSEFASERKRVAAISKVFGDLADGFTFNVIVRTTTQRARETPEFVLFPRAVPGQSPFEMPDENFLGIRSGTTDKTIHELSIEIGSDSLAYPIELSAAGIGEALFLATSIGSASESVIFLDEPAQKMHPTLQRKLLDSVRESARSNHNQFFLITHSPYLIRADDTSCMWRFDSKNRVTTTESIGETLRKLDGNDLAKIQVSLRSADIRALLFSRGVVLVEGPSDKIVVEKVDTHLAGMGKSADLSSKEWSIVEVGGKNSFPTFVRLCKILGLSMIAVVDHDALSFFEETDSKKVFAFATDLEDAMRIELKGGDRKPLRAIDEVMTQVQAGRLTQELHDLGDFLKRHVT